MATLLDLLTEKVPQFRKARLPSLYSDFRTQQYSNPDGYAANLVAWEAALAFAAEYQALPDSTDTLSVTAGPGLLAALESSEWGEPSALGTVFTQGVANGQLVPMSIFLSAKSGSIDQTTTSISWRVISWAMRQAGVSTWIPDKMPTGDFVILTNLKKANEKLMSLITEPRGRIEQVWPMSKFRSSVATSLGLKEGLSEKDLQVLLIYLARDRKFLAYNEHLIKFRASASEPLKITEQDQNIVSLKSLILDLSEQTRQLNSKIELLNQEARDALAAKNRTAALRHLKSKKIQESLFSQRSDTLLQLEDVLSQIEQAATQVEVMSVLKSSTSVLKGLNSEIGDLDSLQDILDGINEEMMKTQEISTTIGDSANAGIVIDESEVDDELAALEAETMDKTTENEVQKVQEKLDQLPALVSEPKSHERAKSAQQAIAEQS